jgi:hypothetical protein
MGTKPDLTRVRERPDPESWGEDELITLAEAAELFWPKGPLRTASLRTAARDGQLAIAAIAGKFMTTPRALKEMATCAMMKRPSGGDDEPLSAKTFVRHLVEATERRHEGTEVV